jgi:endonuclease/exonuclease/phosphatase family metal-dependent hydrolase
LFLYVLVLLWLATGIASMQVSPQVFWPLGFLSFSTPGPLVLNVLFLLYWLFKRSWAALVPVLVIGVCWDYYQRGLTMNVGERPVSEEENRVQVLTFNVRVFNTYEHLRDTAFTSSKGIINFVARHPADVILLQEYYNDPNSKIFSTEEQIGAGQGKESFVSSILTNKDGSEFGLAIFSRYPILHRDRIRFDHQSINHAMFADIKVHSDTIRVYNVHLQSMSIDDGAVAAALRGEQVRREGKTIFKRLRGGFLARSGQVDTLLAHIASSPYPVVVGGDMNDIPWSYTYESFTHQLTNAFQELGTGWGTTYNGQIPFLRIDHQFYSDRLHPYQITIHKEMPYSDHLPMSVGYSLGEPENE